VLEIFQMVRQRNVIYLGERYINVGSFCKWNLGASVSVGNEYRRH
jgi:hypothetical protein